MSAADPADPTPSPAQNRALFPGRLFLWGIGFWILLWISSILVEVGLQVDLKDRPCMMLGVGSGSLVVTLNHQDVRQASAIHREGPFFIWSGRNRRLHSEHPEFLFARLGCMMTMRNIQCAMRSYWGMHALNSGDLIPWDEIFGPRKFLPSSCRTCPSRQDYILDARIPAEYQLVVKCRNPEHQRRVKRIDTSGW